MSEATRARFAEVVRSEPVDLGLACLLVGGEVDSDLDVDQGLTALDALAARARALVPPGSRPAVAAGGLGRALGEQAGYRGSAADYHDVRGSLLHEVLRRGSGLPLLLSVLWAEVARRLDVVAEPVALPGHVIVAVGADDPVYVDPFAGGRLLAVPEIAALVQSTTGAPLRPEHLDPAPTADLLLRLLTNVRALAVREGTSAAAGVLSTVRMQRWAVELSLLLPRHPVALRREYGEILARLGEHARGAAELEAYADIVDGVEPAAAQTARRQARLARAQLN